MILICLVMNICAYCSVYSPYEANVGYNKYSTISSYQYEFKSTSSYAPMVQYHTVKPLDRSGFVSGGYTTYGGAYKPRKSCGLDVDDDEQIPGELSTPVGDPDIYIIIFLLVSYLVCQYLKNRKSQMLLLNIQKQ